MRNGDYQQIVEAIDRLTRVLGVLSVHYLGDAELSLKAGHLNRCGFSNTEIANILGSTRNSINVALHKARHSKRESKKQNKN